MVSNPKYFDSSYDYEKLGFRAGLEIHAQIKAKRKLFCHCKPIMTPPGIKPDYTFERRFRPVLGEMGDYDLGMLIEFEKDYRVRYYTFQEPYGVCTYEMDETPPFFPDQEAIDVGFYLAHYYNCQSLVDELIFNRKQYLDGSITTGFQRTAVLGRDGWILVNNRKIRISNFNVEEDAARRVDFNDRTDRAVFFNLDRLSIPLVEIITNHEDCRSCQDLHDLALLLGLGLRVTGKGVRGIGSIRQDVNISINRGNRAELKGVQNIAMLQTYVDREIQRQLALIELMDELKERGVQKSDFEHYYIDVHDPVDKNGDLLRLNEWIAFAVRLPKCSGLLSREVQPGKSFALEIFGKAELISGLPTAQMFHSDDFPTWMKGNDAYEEFKKALGLQEEDAFILAVGEPNRVIHTLKKIIERMKLALKGVPQETRRVLPNGNSEFLRVIHGKDRLYPDTDTEGIPIVPERLKRILGKYQPPKP
ncbi:MAG: Glu-tRNA(Gln) amidotransferase subunit GatE, partial [Candidatus Hodarchaeales archaeon]